MSNNSMITNNQRKCQIITQLELAGDFGAAAAATALRSLLAPSPLIGRKRIRPCGGGFPHTLVAEGHAECILPRCGQLFPDG